MNAKNIIIIIGVAILIFAAGYWTGIYCDRATDNQVRNELHTVGENQRTITSSIKPITSAVRESGEIIAECQSILREIRKNPKAEN